MLYNTKVVIMYTVNQTYLLIKTGFNNFLYSSNCHCFKFSVFFFLENNFYCVSFIIKLTRDKSNLCKLQVI